MLIRRLFARIALMPPGTEALQIHQVVAAFQINSIRYVQPKKTVRFSHWSVSIKNGTSAIKMRKVSGIGGHAAYSKRPESIER